MEIPLTETKAVKVGTISIGEVKWDEEKSPKGKMPYALLRVFINDPRRPGMGNIVDDFKWRRVVDYSHLAHDLILHEALAKLVKVYASDTKLSFSRYAGCGMCPCSPGLILTHNDKFRNGKSASVVWLTLNYDK